MSSKLPRALLASACLTALPAWSATIFDGELLEPNAAWTGGTPEPSNTIFSWGPIDDAKNVTRTLTYTGADTLLLTGVQFAGTVRNTFGASSGNTAYETSKLLLARNLGFTMTLSNSADPNKRLEGYVTNRTGTLLDTAYTFNSGNMTAGFINLNRSITTGTTFTFEFWGASPTTLPPYDTPDAVYQSLRFTAVGNSTDTPQLTVSSTALEFAARRAGTTGSQSLATTVSNTGVPLSTLTGSATAPTGGFIGSAANFNLTQPDPATNPSQNLTYGYAAGAALTGTQADVHSGAVAITSNGVADPTHPQNVPVTLTGTTVGPVFTLTGDGVAPGAIDFGSVLITKSSAAPTNTNDLKVTNSFDAQGVAYGTSLTGLTAATGAKTGTNPGAFTGGLTRTVIPDNQGTNFTDLQMAFTPNAGGTKDGQAYSARVNFNTDVNAPTGLGGTGASHGYDLTGTAYLATLTADPATADFGPMRIGGNSVQRTLDVTNETGGGYALDNVTFGNATNVSPGGTVVTGQGNANIGSLTSGATGGRAYTMGATAALGTPTTAQALSARVNVVSDQADLAAPTQLIGTAVGPVYELSRGGSVVNPTSTITFDNVLITKNGPQGPAVNPMAVTNRFDSQSVAYDPSLTGLRVMGADYVGDPEFSGAPTSAIITDDNGNQNFNMTFAPTAGQAGGRQYTSTVTMRTDAGAVSGGAGNTYQYNLQGSAYLATLQEQPTTQDFSYVRIGDSKAQAVQVKNNTGGGFALTNVTFGNTAPGSAFTAEGAANVGTVADQMTGQRSYRVTPSEALAPQTSPRLLEGTMTISSDQAADINPTLSAQAVSPLFNLSGDDVRFDYQDDASCLAATCAGGTINLGALTAGSVTKTLTLSNLFGPTFPVGDLADLTLFNVGFWNGSDWTNSVVVNSGGKTGTFTVALSPPDNVLDPGDTLGVTLSFNSADPGFFSTVGFSPLAFRTDVRGPLGDFATEFDFNLTAPIPPTLALFGVGLVGLGAARRYLGRR